MSTVCHPYLNCSPNALTGRVKDADCVSIPFTGVHLEQRKSIRKYTDLQKEHAIGWKERLFFTTNEICGSEFAVLLPLPIVF
jgi:hypothetical protein